MRRRHRSTSSAARRRVGLLSAGLLLICGAPAHALDAGDDAPGFSARSLTGGTPLSLDAFRGKVVLLDFWASWCTPCLSSLPQLDALREEFPAAQFQVLAVNVDDDPAKAVRFLEKRPVGYPSAADPEGRIPERFELSTMPTSYLIDRGGVIRYVHEGFRRGDEDALRREIAALLGSDR